MTFNGAVSTRLPTTSPGRYAGYDNGWAISLLSVPIMEFNKSIVDFPSIKRFPGGASNDTEFKSSGPRKPSSFDGSQENSEDHRLRRLVGWFDRETRRAASLTRRPVHGLPGSSADASSTQSGRVLTKQRRPLQPAPVTLTIRTTHHVGREALFSVNGSAWASRSRPVSCWRRWPLVLTAVPQGRRVGRRRPWRASSPAASSSCTRSRSPISAMPAAAAACSPTMARLTLQDRRTWRRRDRRLDVDAEGEVYDLNCFETLSALTLPASTAPSSAPPASATSGSRTSTTSSYTSRPSARD